MALQIARLRERNSAPIQLAESNLWERLKVVSVLPELSVPPTVYFMEPTAKKLRLGLPKGSLQDSTFHMLGRAGWRISVGSRNYVPTVDDPEMEARLIRAQEISRYVEQGILDCGLTGYDWIVENDSDVVEVANLVYAKQGLRPVRWGLAGPNDAPVRSVKDLEGKRI